MDKYDPERPCSKCGNPVCSSGFIGHPATPFHISPLVPYRATKEERKKIYADSTARLVKAIKESKERFTPSILRECGRCGNLWHEAPLDAPHKPSNTPVIFKGMMADPPYDREQIAREQEEMMQKLSETILEYVDIKTAPSVYLGALCRLLSDGLNSLPPSIEEDNFSREVAWDEVIAALQARRT